MDHVDALPEPPSARAVGRAARESSLPDRDRYRSATIVRRVRREADRSQRELAIATGLSVSWVARVEAGTAMPASLQFESLLALAGWRLAVLDAETPGDPPAARVRPGPEGRRWPALPGSSGHGDRPGARRVVGRLVRPGPTAGDLPPQPLGPRPATRQVSARARPRSPPAAGLVSTVRSRPGWVRMGAVTSAPTNQPSSQADDQMPYPYAAPASEALFDRARVGHAGRRELAGPGVPGGRRHAAVHGLRRGRLAARRRRARVRRPGRLLGPDDPRPRPP